MIQRSKTYSILGISVIALLITAGGFVYQQHLLLKSADTLEGELARLAQVEAVQQASFKNIDLHEETTEERRILQTYVLTEARLIDAISELETIAQQQGLEFETDTISPVEEKKKEQDDAVSKFKLDLSFSGSKNSVQKMLTILEVLPYHSNVDTVALRFSEGVWKASVVLYITVIAYD